MNGRTFNAIALPRLCTVWGDSKHRGRLGQIVEKSGVGRKGEGEVLVTFADETTSWEPFDTVALGDNSVRT